MKPFTQISLAITLLLSAANAQYAIDPNSVSNTTKQGWCDQQKAQCPLICLQTSAASATTEANDCDPASLTYGCVCSNGISPNVSEYSQTLPFYICQEWGNQCVSNCAGDSACQAACRDDHPCGASNPTLQNTSTLSHSRTASATGSGDGSGAATSAVLTDSAGETIVPIGAQSRAPASGNGGGDLSAASPSIVRVWALNAGQTFGSLAIMGVFFGGFAVLL